jgi:mannose-6-phosphate isomerase
MTVPLQIDASATPDASGIRADVLYGNVRFQARLWELAPGARLASFPLPDTQESRSLAITPGLKFCGKSLAPGAERLFKLDGTDRSAQAPSEAQVAGVLENAGEAAALLLEVCLNPESQPVPLAEVTEVRPWGSFTVLKDEPQYKLKQLMVKPGNRLSLQRHQKREEHWLIIQGQPEITLDEQLLRLNPGDYVHIPLHSWHRIANPEGGDPVELIELQLGAYFGEDDIERREDDYGRC